MSDYYAPRPNYPKFDVMPPHKKGIPPKCPQKDIIRRAVTGPIEPRKFIDERGFLVKNNARLGHIAIFDFEYDFTDQRKHSEVCVNDTVYCTFNKASARSGEFEIATIEAVVTKIELIPDSKDFILYLDASKANRSIVYKVGSKAVLDIGLIDNDGNQTQNPIDPAKIAEQIEYHYDYDKRDHCPHNPKLPKRKPTLLDWANEPFELVKNKKYGYTELAIKFKLKHPTDVMLLIYTIQGEIIYKAMDTSRIISSSRIFRWNFRNSVQTFNQFSAIDKFENFTVDDGGRVVITYRNNTDFANQKFDDFNKSNTAIYDKPGKIIIELIAGPNLLEYAPGILAVINKDRFGIATKYELTQDMLKGAKYVEQDSSQSSFDQDEATDEEINDLINNIYDDGNNDSSNTSSQDNSDSNSSADEESQTEP